MPSYLEREQIVPVKPFIAPMEAMLNTYKTRLQYWGYGAAQLKGAENSYKDMELTREDNQEKLGSLMTDAHSKITASAQTDLSVADNRNDAMSAFTPINKDSDIMGDHANTKNWNSIKAKYDSARLKNGGKEFNQAGYEAANYQQQLFRALPKKLATADGQTVDSWKVFYANKDNYMPYYDKTAEMAKLQEMFKTDVIDKTESLGNGYMLHSKDSSWHKDKWQAFVEANASPQLKAQLGVEAKADFRKNLLGNLDNPERVYGIYAQELEGLKKDKIELYGNILADAQLKKNALSKNAPDYEERLKEYNNVINTLGDSKDGKPGYISQIRAQQLPREILSLDKMQAAENTVADLYTRSYFDKMGNAFAHKEITQEFKMDGAYFANKNLEARYAEMKQEANQFNAEMKYKYTALDQAKEIAEANRQVDLAIAGMKMGADGKLELAGSIFATTIVDKTGETNPEKLGQNLIESYEQTVGAAHAVHYDVLQGKYFGSDEFIKKLTEVDGTTKLSDVRTVGGIGPDQTEQVAQFLASAYWGKGQYKLMGIDTSDPQKAMAAMKEKIKNSPVSYVKKMLNMAFDQPNMIRASMGKAQDTPGGMAIIAAAESAKQELEGKRASFNQKYGPTAAKALDANGYPRVVTPGSALWNAGVRGTQQDGVYRVPTQDEIANFARVQFSPEKVSIPFEIGNANSRFMNNWKDEFIKAKKEGKKPSSFASPEWNLFGKSSGALDADAAFSKAKNADEYAEIMRQNYIKANGIVSHLDKIKSSLHSALGQEGAAALNSKVEVVPINEKNRANATSILTGVGAMMTDDNDEDAQKLMDLAIRNPEAVSAIRYYSNGVDGKAGVSIILNETKMGEDKSELPSNYQNIRINSTSEAIPLRHRTSNAGYLNSLEQVQKQTVEFPGKEPVTISLQNHGGLDKPDFRIDGTFYVPLQDKNNNFVYNEDGTVKMDRITPAKFQEMLNASTRGNLDKDINIDPTRIFRDAYLKAYQSRELINYLNTNKDKPKSFAEIPENFIKELAKIIQ
jgi:hypothetical protein